MKYIYVFKKNRTGETGRFIEYGNGYRFIDE